MEAPDDAVCAAVAADLGLTLAEARQLIAQGGGPPDPPARAPAAAAVRSSISARGGMRIFVKALTGKPALLFLTDGHESPPVNARYRPSFTVERGEIRGLIVGVGGDVLLPIPKFDPSGNPQGLWGANEVLQVDPRSLGRGGSVGGEQMVDPEEAQARPLPGVTPGAEHLSSLREDYLRLLAGETGLSYQRLGDEVLLLEALSSDKLAHAAPAVLDLRPWLGVGALLCLLLPLLSPLLLPLLLPLRPRLSRRPPRGSAHQAAAARATRPQR